MRVLHVIPSVSEVHGGPSKAIKTIELALVQRGIAVTIATTDDNGLGLRMSANQLPKSVGAKRVYFPKRLEFYKVSPSMLWWLWRNVPSFDIVHIHALFSFSSIAAAFVARLKHIPYVIRPLGTLNNYGIKQRRPLLKKVSLALFEGPLLRDASAVHFTSHIEQSEAADCGFFMKGVVIPLGIEAHAPATDALVRTQFPSLQDSPYLLYLSRLDPKKNVESLLHAFAQCHPQVPDIKLLIAGSGSSKYTASLKKLADATGLSGHVIWTGHVDGALKASALAGATLFVLASFSENFGIAAAEAMMAGLPCVLGQGVAIAQDVVDAGAGVAVLPDSVSIATGMLQVLANPHARASMAKNASALACSKFSVDAMGRNLVELYETLAGQRPTK
jgi:glycosyltransferase involved in cell wall biosynthesis